MKKLISLLIVCVMVLSFCMVSYAEEDTRPTITATIYDRGNIPASVGTLQDNPIVTWINENSPVKVEYVSVPRWTAAEAEAAMFAAGTAPDLIFEYNTDTWVNEGYAMPLDDLIEEYSVEYKALLEQYPSTRKIATPSGKDQMYTFCRIWPSTNYNTILVREDWLEAVGMELPTDLESFKELLLAFVNDDPDGNGEDDTYGFAASGNTIVTYMFGRADYPHFDENGDICYCSERIVAQYEFLKWLYDNDIIDKDYLTDTNGEKATADFVNGKMGIITESDVVAESTIRELYKNDPDARVVTMAMPTTEFGSYVGHFQGGLYNCAFINKDCTHPEDCIKFIDFMQSDEFYARVMFGVEGVHYHFDENGVPVRTEAEQAAYTAEMQWASGFDYCMAYAKIKMPAEWLNPLLKLTEDSDRAAIDYAQVVYDGTRLLYEGDREAVLEIQTAVDLPTDIQFIKDSYDAEFDGIWSKAVTGGDDYTIEDALEDYNKLCEEINYSAYVEFMTDWFTENRENIFIKSENLELKPSYID